nr:ribonuclease H-like domain-containing protein [Tanacetum cinerariifolium]
SQNHPYKSSSHRSSGHRPHGAPMRPPLRSSGHRPHGGSMRPSHRSAGYRPHVKTPYRAPWAPTINRYDPPVNRKFSTGRKNFPTPNRKFPTTSKKFTTGSTKNHTADVGRKRKVVKPSACWTWNPSQKLSNKGPNNNSVSVMFKKYTYIDTQGRLKYMTGNISYLSDFKPFDGGYVSFGQGGCKITGKGTIKTGKLEFENHNMYSIDLNNIVPHKDLTCLVAKASFDECILWHRRLGHLNVKTMNKL